MPGSCSDICLVNSGQYPATVGSFDGGRGHADL